VLEEPQVVVADLRRKTFSARFRRPEEIVEIRAIPREAAVPAKVLAVDREVRALVAPEMAGRRVRGREAEVHEADGVVDVEVIAEADRVLVSLQHRITAVDREVLGRLIGSLADDELLVVDR